MHSNHRPSPHFLPLHTTTQITINLLSHPTIHPSIKHTQNISQAQNPDIISDVRGWGLINGVELSQASGLQAAKVVQVRHR